MDQRVLAFVKVGLWLADCSPVESHPLLHHHHLLLDVLMPKGLCAALGCALVVPAPALPGWVAGWLRVASAYLPWCGVWVGPAAPSWLCLVCLELAAYLLLVCAGALPGWCASVPCGLGCVSPLSPLPCGLVALPHTVSLVWVWWPGLRGSGVRGVPWLPGRGVLTPGHE